MSCVSERECVERERREKRGERKRERERERENYRQEFPATEERRLS